MPPGTRAPRSRRARYAPLVYFEGGGAAARRVTRRPRRCAPRYSHSQRSWPGLKARPLEFRIAMLLLVRIVLALAALAIQAVT